MKWPSKSTPKEATQSQRQKSRVRKRRSAPSFITGNIWGATLQQLSNLSGVLEEPEPVVDHLVDDQDLPADLEDDFFGSIRSDIVGVQYYKGTVSNNEMVNLVREPMNKYDTNAVRVDNVTNEQVGHIKREHAKALSWIVDNNLAKVEGLIPFGSNNKFRIPVVISLWGAPDKKAQALAVLTSHYISVDSSPVKKASSVCGLGLGTSSGHGQADYGHVVSQRTFVSPKEMESAMDQMFETLDEGDKTTEANPAQAIKTGLYPHQKQALNWMVCRENKGLLPPFWEKQGDMYINTLTICRTHIRPRSVCGGILADDMGLGKTLEVISLILTNFVDGKPLAWPVQGTTRCSIGASGKSNVKAFAGKRSIVNTSMSCGKSEPDVSKPHFTLSCSSSVTPKSSMNLKLTKAFTCPPNLSAVQVKTPATLSEAIGECKSDDTPTPMQKVEVKSNPTTVDGLSRKGNKDPDFVPDLPEKVIVTTPASRSRRERKRPIRYCYSDEEDDRDKLKESKPTKRKGKGVGKKSTPLAAADFNRCEDSQGNKKEKSVEEKAEKPVAVLSEVKLQTNFANVPEDIKENAEVLQTQIGLHPPNQNAALVAVQESQKDNSSSFEQDQTSVSSLPNIAFTGAQSDSTLGQPKYLSPEGAQASVLPTNIQSTSKTDATSVELVKVENNTKTMSTPDSAEVIVIDDSEDFATDFANNDCVIISSSSASSSLMGPVANNDCVIISSSSLMGPVANNDSEIISSSSVSSSQMGSKTQSLSKFLQVASTSSPEKTKNAPTLPEPEYVFDSDDDLPDIPPSAPENRTVHSPIKLGSDYEAATGRAKTAGPRATLIICPLSVISNWVGQFEEHLHQQVHISLYVYYGGTRKKDVKLLREQDVVITTYSTLASDFKSVKKSPLHEVEWLRIVLDEGHIIRNPSSQQAKAVYQLQARRKWVITGTPIQNSMKDLWSLVNFLGVKPFTEKVWWNRTIARPLAHRDGKAIQRVSHLMRNLAMRRTKNQQLNGRPLIALPDRHVYLERIAFGEEERAVYEAMQTNGQVIIGRYFRQGTLLHHYGEVLAILTRLRQLCCHPQLVAAAVKRMLENNPAAAINEAPEPAANAVDPQVAAPAPAPQAVPALTEEERQRLINQLLYVLDSGSDQECAVCLESVKRGVITACAHVYCRPCIEAVIDNEQPSPKCPLCRAELSKDQLIEAPAEDSRRKDSQNESGAVEGTTSAEEESEENKWPTPEAWQSSAKIDALMKGLTQLREQDPKIKSIVVSQFTSLLDLIEIPLGMQGFHFARLDGSMSAAERVEAVEEFSAEHCGAPTVFLLSLKAGGVGINLTAASRVFLMDPAWNPASEEQCFDRCHRLGQTREVIITRFVIDDTVEDRMLELQDKKRQLMKGAFGRTQSREERRTNLVNMIRNLIRI